MILPMMWALSWDPGLFVATHVKMHTIHHIMTLRDPTPHPCCCMFPFHIAICAFTCPWKLPNANSYILLKPMKDKMLHEAPEVILDLPTSHSLLTWCPPLGVKPTTSDITQKKPQPQIHKRASCILFSYFWQHYTNLWPALAPCKETKMVLRHPYYQSASSLHLYIWWIWFWEAHGVDRYRESMQLVFYPNRCLECTSTALLFFYSFFTVNPHYDYYV